MRLEIPDTTVPGNLVQHYAEIKKRFKNARPPAPKAQPKPKQDYPWSIRFNPGPVVIRFGNKPPRGITMAAIVDAVCEKYRLTDVDIFSHRRTASVVRPRQIVMYLARELTARSLPDIGRYMRRDHTTAMWAHERITKLIEKDPALRADVAALRYQLVAMR